MKNPRRGLQFAVQLLIAVLIYAVQFMLLPGLLPQFFPQSNEATALLLIPLLLFSTAGVLLLDLKLWHWLVADLLLGFLLCLYDGNGLYGIGLRGVFLDGTMPRYHKPLALAMIAGLLLLMLLLQCLSLPVKRLLKRNTVS